MRPLIAQTMAVFLAVSSLGAASRLNNSGDKESANSVQQHKVKVRGQASRTQRVQRTQTHKVRVKAKARKDHPYQVGRASWYGKSFHGKKTASGETYNMFEFTAAHPELPLGTYLKVTNLRNGRWVVVRVNDRGPVPTTRIIDLSYGAAQMLGLRAHGVERVRLDVVQPETVASEQQLAGLTAPGAR